MLTMAEQAMQVATPLPPSTCKHHRSWQLALMTGLGSWLILACTTSHMPIVWDEGDYLFRADQIVGWFRLLVDIGNPQGGLHAFSRGVIRDHWLFINWSEGHSSWFAIPIAIGKGLLSGLLHPLTAARLGPITVFSTAAGAMSLRLKQEYGTVAALVTPIALLTFPRIFADAHFAAGDGQVTAWWLLLWAADTSRRRGPRTALVVGILLGLTCATKFTGWLAVLPVIGSRIVMRNRQQHSELWVLLPIALLTFYSVNPPLWYAPLEGLAEHFRLNLYRSEINIPISFLGERYDMHHSLPWYNTVLWVVFVTPVPTLVLGAVGLGHCIGIHAADGGGEPTPSSTWISRVIKRLPEPRSGALLLHWATLMVIRALPGAPPHDGIRLFLPAFGFWCVLAGIGAQRLWEADFRRQGHAWHRKVIPAALAASAINLARSYPQTLSHYSFLVGGVRGAASIGMEPTYWWDALDEDVLDWLNSHTEPGAAVAFSEISDYNVALLQDWGRLRTAVTDPSWGIMFKWYVLQNRPSLLSAADRILIHSEKPAYAKYAGHHPRGIPADLDVPLILVFSYEQYQRAVLSSGLK